jgi:hypothetical protein
MKQRGCPRIHSGVYNYTGDAALNQTVSGSGRVVKR